MAKVELGLLLVAFVFGVILGMGYFAALWWTLGRLPHAARPGLWLAGSFVVRIVLIMGAFYLLLLQGISALAAGLVGFLLARFFWLRRKKPVNPGRQGKDRDWRLTAKKEN